METDTNYVRAEWQQASERPPGEAPHALLAAAQAYIAELERELRVQRTLWERQQSFGTMMTRSSMVAVCDNITRLIGDDGDDRAPQG